MSEPEALGRPGVCLGNYTSRMHLDAERVVREAVRAAIGSSGEPLLLAVSGGLDSMVLLDALARTSPERIAAVATFDHGTGPFARDAVAHVARESAARGLRFVSGTMRESGRDSANANEASWRRARLEFLRHRVVPMGARIATAHHADDQLETVLMRVLRGSGARGLAGLLAPGDIVRPLLAIRRVTIAAYAERLGVSWCADPSNASRRHLRNRVRNDLLPALSAADPALPRALERIGRQAAQWRAEVDAVAASISVRGHDHVRVNARELAGLDPDSLSVLWGAIAGRLGLALDRRGTARLASFTGDPGRRGTIPLSGGWCMEAGAGVYLLRKARTRSVPAVELPEGGTLDWGDFRFRMSESPAGETPWAAPVPVGAVVRAWGPGDRFEAGGLQQARRVKRWLSDAGVHGEDRRGWPIVVAGEDVVWIPGVRRSDAATERSGRPVRHCVCERIHT